MKLQTSGSALYWTAVCIALSEIECSVVRTGGERWSLCHHGHEEGELGPDGVIVFFCAGGKGLLQGLCQVNLKFSGSK